ncbi:MAG: hypothetical protein ACRDTW_34065 [Rhodococcus qingshengii]
MSPTSTTPLVDERFGYGAADTAPTPPATTVPFNSPLANPFPIARLA